MADRRWISCGALLALLLGWAVGCVSGERRGGDGPEPFTGEPSFEAGRALEEQKRFSEAHRVYGALAEDATLSEADRVQARFRSARCLEEKEDGRAARAIYRSILELGHLTADECRLPEPGTLPIHLRLQSEAGLRRTGGDPPLFYATVVRSGAEGSRIVAARSLGRLADPRGREALLEAVNDASTPQTVRQEAREALERLDRAENRQG